MYNSRLFREICWHSPTDELETALVGTTPALANYPYGHHLTEQTFNDTPLCDVSAAGVAHLFDHSDEGYLVKYPIPSEANEPYMRSIFTRTGAVLNISHPLHRRRMLIGPVFDRFGAGVVKSMRPRFSLKIHTRRYEILPPATDGQNCNIFFRRVEFSDAYGRADPKTWWEFGVDLGIDAYPTTALELAAVLQQFKAVGASRSRGSYVEASRLCISSL